MLSRFNQSPLDFSKDALQKLLAYHFSDNIRDLEAVIGAAVTHSEGPLICASGLLLAKHQQQIAGVGFAKQNPIVTDFESDYIIRLLSAMRWKY